MSKNLFIKFGKELAELSESTANQDDFEVIYNLQCDLIRRMGVDPAAWLEDPFQEIGYKKYEVTEKDFRNKILRDLYVGRVSTWPENEDERLELIEGLMDRFFYIIQAFIALGADPEDIFMTHAAKYLEKVEKDNDKQI
jgi:hypothetical protein